jgi:hypothetical protein
LGISYVAWFGGLLRLAGEVAAQLLPALLPSEANRSEFVLLCILTGLAMAVLLVLLYRWPWYLEQLRLNHEGIRKLFGQPPDPPPRPLATTLRRLGFWSTVLILPSVGLALVLPGPVAACLSIAAGLVLRVVATIVASATT